ncbi:flagellar basal body-associated FliL family protein [Salipiger mucosus]|uniref:Flagellar protein FliL n=1 Tax=Salipiger mucosus DSM 16094 TaxID=1123237 RepID=S9RVK4_9RHOB|nr:flagellar basal body-associated FliL family protein [Salipiger mucosus]EPX78009.1 hypothetical protein Salmuc_03331 [Salipiger mucosus DSM 16094]
MSEDDTTDTPEVDGEDAPDVNKGRMKGKLLKFALLILIGGASLTGGLVAAVGIDGVKNAVSGTSEEAHSAEQTHETETEDTVDYAYLNFDEMIVNITGYTASGRKTSRFMKIKLTMVYEDQGPDEATELENKKIFMRDSFQDYLRQLDERDLQGSYGLVRLRSELLKRAKAVTGNQAPQEILIGDLIIQ